jgi:hypothetical protein
MHMKAKLMILYVRNARFYLPNNLKASYVLRELYNMKLELSHTITTRNS